MTIEPLQPHGFCAGVIGALHKALSLLESNNPDRQTIPAPVYCLHELVHNELVVADLRRRGMIFVESLDDVPAGATVLFSAHGVSPSVRRQAETKRLTVVDATCPFVARVHRAARAFAERGLPVVVIGKPSHSEVDGIVGEVEGAVPVQVISRSEDLDRTFGRAALRTPAFGVVSQTTMNADEVEAIVADLRSRCPVETMAEVCRATKERQDAVKAFDGDALLVLGSASSSNTKRLCEVARCRTFRAGTIEEVRKLDFTGIRRLGITSGASTPEAFFQAVADELNSGNVS